jgi:hypothetical protein
VIAVSDILCHGRFGTTFAILLVIPTSTQRMLVVAWWGLPFPCRYQTCCAILGHGKYYPRCCFLQYELVAMIIVINSIKNLIVATLPLTMVDLLSLYAPWQYNASCNIKNIIPVASLAIRHKKYAQ